MIAFDFCVVAAYVVVVGSLARLLVLIVYGRRVIGLWAETEPRRRLNEEEMEALLRALESSRPSPSKGAKVTVASSDEEAFLKLADEGRALLPPEAD